MAKNNSKRDRRGANATTSPKRSRQTSRLHVSPSPKPQVRLAVDRQRPSAAIDDRRVWHPLGDARPAYDTSYRPVKTLRVLDRPRTLQSPLPKGSIKVGKKAAQRQRQAQINRFGPDYHSQTKAIVAFAEPGKVLHCIKRKVRREVLHALNKAGRGNRRPTYRPESKIHC